MRWFFGCCDARSSLAGLPGKNYASVFGPKREKGQLMWVCGKVYFPGLRLLEQPYFHHWYAATGLTLGGTAKSVTESGGGVAEGTI